MQKRPELLAIQRIRVFCANLIAFGDVPFSVLIFGYILSPVTPYP